MDIEAELKKLVGQRVNIDQSHTAPPSLTGILVDLETGYYAVEDDEGRGETMFDWSQVERVVGYGISLEDPAGVNECPPDYPIDNSEFEEQAEWGYLDLPRRGEEDEEW